MKIILITLLLFSLPTLADKQEETALKYFDFLFYEDQSIKNRNDKVIAKPLVSSFYSKSKNRMIIVSAEVSTGQSYYVLMSVNELKMGYLLWKQRGYGLNPKADIEGFMTNDGQEFGFKGW